MSAEEDIDIPEPTLRGVIEDDSLRWIFVGGKGGVGKTTTSCSLAVQLAKRRESVLVVSTDPAHNLSDAFRQRFGSSPTKVEGYSNLYCMEVDPKKGVSLGEGAEAAAPPMLAGMMKDLSSSMPGIDEATSFAELLKHIQKLEFSCIVFDTAPTGHTLRLLAFPETVRKAMGTLQTLQSRMGGLMAQASSMLFGEDAPDPLARVDELLGLVSRVETLFKDKTHTTFVCVCIPEFLSLYETERLVQELNRMGIHCNNIVVNQVLLVPPDSSCRMCNARKKIQAKYMDQLYDLYETFHVVEMPLLGDEVRGPEALERFGAHLITPYTLPGEAAAGGGSA